MSGSLFDQCSEPLIGLHHVTEYWSHDVPNHWCSLCQMHCGPEHRDVIGHVTGRKHRINYISLNYLSYLEVIDQSPKLEHDVLLLEYSRIIEASEGRRQIKSRPRNQSPNFDLQGRTLDSKNVPQSLPGLSEGQHESLVFPHASIGCVLHNIALRAGARNTADLLQKMTKYLVTNEEEAAKALEAANILTRSLLEYRLNGSPK